jgi:hypothetical protein
MARIVAVASRTSSRGVRVVRARARLRPRGEARGLRPGERVSDVARGFTRVAKDARGEGPRAEVGAEECTTELIAEWAVATG